MNTGELRYYIFICVSLRVYLRLCSSTQISACLVMFPSVSLFFFSLAPSVLPYIFTPHSLFDPCVAFYIALVMCSPRLFFCVTLWISFLPCVPMCCHIYSSVRLPCSYSFVCSVCVPFYAHPSHTREGRREEESINTNIFVDIE